VGDSLKDDKSGRWDKITNPSITKKDLSKKIRRAEDVTTRHARRFIFKRLDGLRDVRRHIVLWIVAVGVLIGATGIQLMWYQQGYKTKAPQVGGTYAEAALGPLNTLNPLFASSPVEKAATKLVFSSLFEYDSTGSLRGDLASSLKIDSTGTLYTVQLRTDALWHDGFRVTAKDVAFTINLLKNPSLRSTSQEDWSDVVVKAVDDQTVTFKLPTIIAAFSNALTFPVLPSHILSAVDPAALREHEFSKLPIGSGPFKTRLIQDVNLTLGHRVLYLDRNPDFYRGVSRLERIQLHSYDSQESMAAALNTSEVNAASDLSISTLDIIDKSRFKVESVPVKSGVYALINTKREITKDVAVRKALRLATDVEAIRSLFSDLKPSLSLPFINGQLRGDIPSVPGYNVAAAKELLNSSGWVLKDGVRQKSGVKLKLTVVSTKDNNRERTLEALFGQWREIGVEIEIVNVDLSDASQRANQDIIQSRDYDVIIYQLDIGADPDVFAYWHSSQTGFGGFNLSNYSNKIVDDALSSARSRLETNIRNAKYITFAKQWINDVPAIGLYQVTTYYAHGKNDRVFGNDAKFVSSLDRYANVLYWSVGSESVYKTP